MEQRFRLKIGDILLMAGIFLLAAVLFLFPFLEGKAASAEILIVETGEKRVVSLNEDAAYEITSCGVSLTVRVTDGEVFVERADCPDSVCRNTPAISRAGQSIVCAPAGVVVRVLGEEVAVDGVSG